MVTSPLMGLLSRALAIAAAAFPGAAVAQDAPKTHTLFMGADFAVGIDKGVYPVRDVSGSSWVIDVNGRARVVSASTGSIQLQITPSLKLTETSATIANLKGGRAYTFGNDPSVLLTQGLSGAAELNADYRSEVNQAFANNAASQVAAQIDHNTMPAINGPINPNSTTPSTILVQNALAAASQNLATTSAGAGSDLSMGGKRVLTEGLDAMELTFEVSAKRPLYNPYVVTITRFHEKGGKPGTVRNLVYAKALDPIDERGKKIHIVEGGFPPDFELREYQVHLYDRGVEIATNVSAKRVELTRDEAFEYVKMEYIGSHKNDTLPPVPAMGELPSDLPAQLAAGKYGATYYVRVSRDGVAEGAFLDAGCSKRIADPYLESAVKSILFKPSLDKGRPVDGVASLKLGNLTI